MLSDETYPRMIIRSVLEAQSSTILVYIPLFRLEQTKDNCPAGRISAMLARTPGAKEILVRFYLSVHRRDPLTIHGCLPADSFQTTVDCAAVQIR